MLINRDLSFDPRPETWFRRYLFSFYLLLPVFRSVRISTEKIINEMGVVVTNEKVNEKIILMSNISFGEFLETICLAGADIAEENYQKDLMIWFAQHDWSILGLGCNGFDVSDIIWSRKLFGQQKRFMNKVIDLAADRTNWELVEDYEPDEDRLTKNLSDFKEMLSEFRLENIQEESGEHIFDFDGNINIYEKCDRHNVYKHCRGCIICNR